MAPTLVNAKLLPLSLITPFNTIVLAPPIVVLLPKVRLLLNVSVEVLAINAPVPPTPIPFKVIELVLAKVLVAKLRFKVAPLVTLVPLD